MDQETLQQLIERINNNTASEEDLRRYNAWCNALQDKGVEMPDFSEIQAGMFHRVRERIDGKRPVRRLPVFRIAAAASLLLCIGLAGYYFLRQGPAVAPPVAVQPVTNVIPGGNKAMLTLSDGSKISLEDAASGSLAQQSGATITKTANGEVIYTPANGGAAGTSATNTISTPNGGRWQVRLPDGTTVWLNAASSLTYPVSFADAAQRRVTLSGEAYFEVAKDPSKPFLVETGDQHTEVLGTHFNINAYKDDGALRTTLLEGSVKVAAGHMEKIIRPGEAAVLKQGRLQVSRADIAETMAWKNGMFRFDQETLQHIMQQIARWYDVEITYTDEQVKQLAFSGIISQFSDVSKVLRMLELTEQVHFLIDGRKITVIGGTVRREQ